MKTVELYSLADKYATNRTIANAIGWNPFNLNIGQIDYLWNKEKVKMTDQYRSRQIIRKIKEQNIHFKIKRIFFIGIPSSDRIPQYERSYYDSGMHFLHSFESNGISYELVQSEGMTEDLDNLQRNNLPLYDRVVKNITKESPKLNDFEKTAIDYKYGGHDPSLFDPGYFDAARNEATELLSLAREQFIKDGYVIEKKAFHDAIEKVNPEVMEQVSEAVNLSNFEYAMLRYVQEGANAKNDEELIELTKKYSKELHKYI